MARTFYQGPIYEFIEVDDDGKPIPRPQCFIEVSEDEEEELDVKEMLLGPLEQE
jgi:hypothetical protein